MTRPQILEKLQETKEIITTLEKAVKAIFDLSDWTGLGVSEKNMKKYEEAKNEYEATVHALQANFELLSGELKIHEPRVISDNFLTADGLIHLRLKEESDENGKFADYSTDETVIGEFLNKVKVFHKRLEAKSVAFDQMSDGRSNDLIQSEEDELVFDAETGNLKLGNKKACQLPLKKMEYYLADILFSKPWGTRVSETQIIEYFDSERCKGDSATSVYDTRQRLNKRILKDLGLNELIDYQGSNYWLRKIT